MSHKDEVMLQGSDDEAYEKWLKGTPEYWAEITNHFTANVIAGPDCDSFAVSGMIETDHKPGSCQACGHDGNLHMDDICPKCRWQQDILEQDGWSAPNGATLDEWRRNGKPPEHCSWCGAPGPFSRGYCYNCGR